MTLKELLAKQQAGRCCQGRTPRPDRGGAARLTNIRRRLMHSSPAANRTTPQPVRQPPSAPIITNITAMCRDFGLDAEPYIRNTAE